MKLVVLIICAWAHFLVVYGATLEVNLTISEGLIAPDNFEQRGILINGQFPGPEIRVDRNDTLIIHLQNDLPTGFALHMHGILQRGSVESDGAPHVTQELIQPNASYTYSVDIGFQAGTFMYHAHTALDLVWAFGPLIINEDPRVVNNSLKYYDEKTFLLSQAWHETMESILEGLTGAPFEDVPDTASVLINGRSWGEWSGEAARRQKVVREVTPSNSTHSEGYEVITVSPNETYRFRVIGMGMDSMLTFSIDNHTELSIIEVDGILVDPVLTDRLQVNSAQRYSVLVTMDQPVGNYWIHSTLTDPGPDNGRAILHYEGAPDPSELRRELFGNETEEVEVDEWILDSLHPTLNINVPQPEVYPVPLQIDREIVISSFQRVLEEYNTTNFDVNGRIHRHTGDNLLKQVSDGVDIIANEQNGVYEILIGERIQIVFQNRFSDDLDCEHHPWHTHGHTFHVVAYGPGAYDPIVDGQMIDELVKNVTESGRGGFQFRDVVTLFAEQEEENISPGEPCGWTAIRFIADNPGVWLNHCHLTPHQIMGKWFVFYEHEQGKGLPSKGADFLNLRNELFLLSVIGYQTII